MFRHLAQWGQTLLKLCKLFRKGIDKEIDGIEESTLRKIRVLRIVKRSALL